MVGKSKGMLLYLYRSPALFSFSLTIFHKKGPGGFHLINVLALFDETEAGSTAPGNNCRMEGPILIDREIHRRTTSDCRPLADKDYLNGKF